MIWVGQWLHDQRVEYQLFVNEYSDELYVIACEMQGYAKEHHGQMPPASFFGRRPHKTDRGLICWEYWTAQVNGKQFALVYLPEKVYRVRGRDFSVGVIVPPPVDDQYESPSNNMIRLYRFPYEPGFSVTDITHGWLSDQEKFSDEKIQFLKTVPKPSR